MKRNTFSYKGLVRGLVPVAALVAIVCLPLAVLAQRPWQNLQDPSVAAVAQQFKSPPPEYAATATWGWNGPVTEMTIRHDLDSLQAQGIQAVSIEAGYEMPQPYLSEGWFQLVKVAVEEARKRNMRVWIIDEGKYPSGFAGGKFSAERPDLRMQGLVSRQIKTTAGEKVSLSLSPQTLSAAAVNLDDQSNIPLPLQDGRLEWTVPAGNWEIIVASHRFRTSVTRAANNPTRGKDTLNSLCDYLNPVATRQFLEFTHVQYKKYIGAEFGKTVLGFRGDEPDYGFTPWTPALPEEFRKRKGYDVRPYLASFFAPKLSPEQQKAKADYWDVWSDLFRDNFFKIQADWCAANNLEYFMHLNHEEKMMALVRSEGHFFKAMRYVHIPGVDAIWNQIWPDKVADFPKLASSASHLYGRPRAFSESFAAYNPRPTVPEAKWVIDHQLARGINFFELMFVSSSAASGQIRMSGYLASKEFPAVAAYLHRASYLLAQGRPMAQIALYHPAYSLWLGQEEANTSVLHLAQQLLEKQHDFDFVDEHALGSLLTIRKGQFQNQSEQRYSTLIIPTASVLSQEMLHQMQAFTKGGGKVIFLGQEPDLLVGKTFLNSTHLSGLTWALREPSGKFTPQVLAALPAPDVVLSRSNPAVKYVHRRLKDGDVYFFFNEGETAHSGEVTLAGKGKAHVWNAETGTIAPIAGAKSAQSTVKLPLPLQPHETRIVVIQP